jgi:hypothetical protein
MKRYRDRPMDFADATLVHAGSELKLADIVTIDHDDFETIEWAGAEGFASSLSAEQRRADSGALLAYSMRESLIMQAQAGKAAPSTTAEDIDGPA